jgi:O-antigen/teichoic acid export membrane protein
MATSPSVESAVSVGARFDDDPLSAAEVRRRATRGAAGLMVRGCAIRAIGLLGNVVLARLLTPREFGMIALGVSVSMVGDFLASGGLAASLIKREGGIDTSDLRAMLGFQLVITTAFTAGVAVAAIPLGKPGLVAAVMVSSLIIDTMRAPNGILLERRLEYRLIVRAEVVETVAWNGWAVAMVLAGMGIWGVATAQVFRAIVGAAFLTANGPAGVLFPLWSWTRTRAMLSLGVKFQALSLVQLARDQGLGIVVAAVGGLAILGLWSIVYRLTLVVGVLLESLWRVSFPAMSRILEAREDPGPALERGLTVASTVTGLLVAPLAGSAPALVPFLFGSRWTGAVAAMPAVGLSLMLAGPVSALGIGYMLSSGRATRMLVISIAESLAMWIVSLTLLPFLHVVALSLGALAAAALLTALLGSALRRGAGVCLVNAMLAPILAWIIGALPAWWLASSWGETILAALAAPALAVSVYVAALLLIRRSAVVVTLAITSRAVRRSPAQA